jgi:hypothetical protein
MAMDELKRLIRIRNKEHREAARLRAKFQALLEHTKKLYNKEWENLDQEQQGMLAGIIILLEKVVS